jgi:hypothetical protein
MATYKNIRIKMKNGKSRLQRVQVLANGKYKFVKNTGSASKPRKRKAGKTRGRGTTTAKKKSYKSRAKGLIGKYGAIGLAEDTAIGYIGSQVLMARGYPLESALPMTRVIQGIAGKALKRRGGARLEHGIIDLLDVYLIKQGFNLQGIGLGSLR